jgi:hypothetical protein
MQARSSLAGNSSSLGGAYTRSCASVVDSLCQLMQRELDALMSGFVLVHDLLLLQHDHARAHHRPSKHFCLLVFSKVLVQSPTASRFTPDIRGDDEIRLKLV